MTDNVFKSMQVGNLGLGTYPSQILRLLYPFLHGSIKIGPTVAINILSDQLSRFEEISKNNDLRNVGKSRIDGKSRF